MKTSQLVLELRLLSPGLFTKPYPRVARWLNLLQASPSLRVRLQHPLQSPLQLLSHLAPFLVQLLVSDLEHQRRMFEMSNNYFLIINSLIFKSCFNLSNSRLIDININNFIIIIIFNFPNLNPF